MYLVGLLKRKEGGNGGKATLEEKTVTNFLKLVNDTSSQVQEPQGR